LTDPLKSASALNASVEGASSLQKAFPEPGFTSLVLLRKSLWRRCLLAAVLADSLVASLGRAQPVVLINGFWRSGTTWLQESLAESLSAKTVFEPLSPEGPHRRRVLRAAGIDNLILQHALIHGAAAPNDSLWTYLDDAITGKTGDFATLICRNSLNESWRRLIIAKEVRLHFNLRAAHDRYGLPIVHIRRHPAAVVSSLLNIHWGRMFDTVRLAQLLPDRAAELQTFDQDVISRISAYWAVTERFVDQTIAGAPWAKIISYEEAVATPDKTITHLCNFIGQPQRKFPNFGTASSSSVHKSASDFRPKPARWRDTLSNAEIERIRSTVSQLYPEFAFDSAS